MTASYYRYGRRQREPPRDGLHLVDPDGVVRRLELPVLPTTVGAVAVDLPSTYVHRA